ncbi:MAG: dienelactone hydrolase family protein [Actinomycetota bacterium]|nr:dienelactone hydrolase family protein [Actinomycetota bacterium]
MAPARDVTFDGPGGPVPGAAAAPEGQPKGGVVVVQEAFGLTGHIRNVCSRLAEAGYLAAAPALFHRQGAPVLGYDEIDKAMPVMGTLRADEILSDVSATVAYLEAEGVPSGKIGIVGFCMGGTIALVAATELPLAASVTYYGGGVEQGRFGFAPLAELAPGLRAPWLGLFGDQDASIPVDQVERLRSEAAKATVPTEVVRYPDAGHGFNCDDRSAFEPASAADAWARTTAFFDRHLDA